MTVLNTIELMEQKSTIPLFIIGIGTLISILSLVTMINANKDLLAILSFIMFIVSGLAVLVTVYMLPDLQEPSGKYRYEIMIDDSTTFSEVMEKYNIIEQRGEIFVVEEKE